MVRRRWPRRLALVLVAGAVLALLSAGGAAAHAAAQPSGDALAASALQDDPVPDELDEREHVEDTSQYAYSAIGPVFDQEPYAGSTDDVGSDGTAVLVTTDGTDTANHALTAAHVVTNDDGEPLEDEVFWFAPGATTQDGEVTAPYGRAHVDDIRVHPDYEGANDHEDDLALLELDRPIAEEAGTFDLEPLDLDDADTWTGEFHHAGYPAEGSLLSGTADGEEVGTILDGDVHVVNAKWDDGDSGSPLFRDLDDPTVHSIAAGHRNGGWPDVLSSFHGAPVTAERVDLIEGWMRNDYTRLPDAELYPAERVTWVDGGSLDAPALLAPDSDNAFEYPLYNNGMADASATVEIYLTEQYHQEPFDAPPDGEPLCRTSVEVPAHETATATCEPDSLAGLEPGTGYDVLPVYSGSHGENFVTEYRNFSSSGTRVYVPEGDLGTDVAVREVTADDGTVERTTDVRYEWYNTGAAGEVTVELRAENDDTGADLGVVERQTIDVEADNAEWEAFSVTPGDEFEGDVTFTVDVLEGGSGTASATFDGGYDGGDGAYLRISDVAGPETVTAGDTAWTKFDVNNLGGESRARIEIVVRNADDGSSIDIVDSETATVSGDLNNRPRRTWETTHEMTGEVEVSVEPANGEEASTSLTVEPDPDAEPELAVRDAGVESGQVGEILTVRYEVQNTAEFEGTETVRVELRDASTGETLERIDEREVDFEARGTTEQRFYTDATLAMSDDAELAVVAGGDDTQTLPLNVEPRPYVAIENLRVEAGQIGDELTVRYDWTNVGSAGSVGVDLEAVSTGPRRVNVHFGSHSLEVGERASGTARTTIEANDSLRGRTLVVRAEDGSSDRTQPDVERPSYDLTADVEEPVLHGAEVLEVNATVSTDGEPLEDSVEVSVRGERGGRDAATVDVGADDSETVTLRPAIDPEPDEWLELTVEAGGLSDADDVKVRDDPQISLGEHEPAPAGEDGKYRDVDGDGRVTTSDVSLFQEHLFTEPVQDNAPYFDFTDSGDVSHGDVIALFSAATGL